MGPPALPEWLDLGAWEQWERYRRSRKGWTVDAKALALRKLAELRAAGHEPRAVIEQSILQGWSGLFPVRGPEVRGAAASAAASEFAGAK